MCRTRLSRSFGTLLDDTRFKHGDGFFSDGVVVRKGQNRCQRGRGTARFPLLHNHAVFTDFQQRADGFSSSSISKRTRDGAHAVAFREGVCRSEVQTP